MQIKDDIIIQKKLFNNDLNKSNIRTIINE